MVSRYPSPIQLIPEEQETQGMGYTLSLYRKDGSIFKLTNIYREEKEVRKQLDRMSRDLMWKEQATFLFYSHDGDIYCTFTDVIGFNFVQE